jgi:hypothetical protein
MPGEIIPKFEDERDHQIIAAIDAGESFTDIAKRFEVSVDHVQSVWEAIAAFYDQEGQAGFIGPWLIVPLALLAWAPVLALAVWGG